MPYDKVIDSAKLEGAITATADAIRAKTGSAEKIPWDAESGYKDAVEGIQSGGEGGPSAENVEFGNVKKTETEVAPEGKLYYGGELLPEIPTEFLDAYQYAAIIQRTSGYIDVIGCASPFYYEVVEGEPCANQSAGAAGRRRYSSETDTWGDVSTGNYRYIFTSIIWSNHDIPKGSATATDIYAKGSDPKTELTTSWIEPADRLEAYTTTGDFLNGVAGYVQNRISTMELLTPQEMLEGLKAFHGMYGFMSETRIGVIE